MTYAACSKRGASRSGKRAAFFEYLGGFIGFNDVRRSVLFEVVRTFISADIRASGVLQPSSVSVPLLQ